MNCPINKQQYDNLVERELTRSRNARRTLKDRLLAFQITCLHKNTKYVPDASGNNDSYTECIECGKEL